MTWDEVLENLNVPNRTVLRMEWVLLVTAGRAGLETVLVRHVWLPRLEPDGLNPNSSGDKFLPLGSGVFTPVTDQQAI